MSQPILHREKSSAFENICVRKPPLHTPSSRLKQVLAGQCKRVTILPELRQDPWKWGLAVKDIDRLHDHIKDDLEGYCSAHELDDKFRHICLRSPCTWDHVGARFASAETNSCVRRPLKGNMHLVVQRYIKPWTAPYDVSYSGLVLGEHASQGLHTETSIARLCSTEVFISHCWNEKFSTFTGSLASSLDASSIVWVCSLSINQNTDVAEEIGGSLFCVPFAKALQGAKRVLVVMDAHAEPLERIWCAFEAHLSFLWEKTYDFTLPDDTEEAAWRCVDDRLSNLDVRNCLATEPTDKERILHFMADHGGGVEVLNANVRRVSAEAAEHAVVFAAASIGKASILAKVDESLLFATNSRERTPLHLAAACNCSGALLLINERTKGSLLDAGDCDGRTPLSVAAEVGAHETAKALIELKADLERLSISDEDKRSSLSGSSPMHIAAANDQANMILLLVEARADLNKTNSGGYSPVSLAAVSNRVQSTSLLIGLRADVNLANRFGFAPLHLVDEKCGDAAVEVFDLLLLHRAELDQKTKDGRTPLAIVAQRGCTRCLTSLVAAKANLALSNKRGYGPLHVAAEKGNIKCIEILITHRADVNQLTKAGNSPLKVAVMYRRKVTACNLLRLQADPEAREHNANSTALHLAAKKGLTAIVKLLLEHGASLDSTFRSTSDRAGHRPWYSAAASGQTETLQVLLGKTVWLAGTTSLFLKVLCDFMVSAAPLCQEEGLSHALGRVASAQR
eukprot:TRINITY_DN17652_c0_g1_i2.p1 TRINITY_DN17652_c0_g1~~TRINITY_DN17652_c0_g1_i2.p1  ORF type:complete len:740 (-),score=113.77 TRINITY_DN17652_c0_g1_i2:590-2809(-)